MKKTFLSIIIIALFTCFLFASENKEYYEFVNEYPTIKLPINGEEYVFLLDTGASRSIMSNKIGQKIIGDKKIDVSEEAYKENLEKLLNIGVSFLKEQPEYSSFSDEELLEIVKGKLKHNNGFICTLKDFYFANKYIKKIRLESDTEYRDWIFDLKNIDGILGLDFLLNFEMVIFDYKQKRIYFDCEPMIKKNLIKVINPYEMPEVNIKSENVKVNKGESPFFISVYVNNEIHDIMIDTGAESALLLSAKTEEELKEAQDKNDELFYKTIKIGNKKYKNIETTYTSSPRVYFIDEEHHKNVETFKLSFLGHDFFKDKIIQFDFKNRTFGIK